jgi:DnaJ like chaperone protein
LNYFENPGPSGFYEGEPGLAAFCALGILIIARTPDSSPFPPPGSVAGGEAAAGEVSRKAAAVFPGGRAGSSPDSSLSLIDYFCRLAWSRRYSLNPDLLAESLMARRGSGKDLPDLGRALYELASGEKSLDLAGYIRSRLDSAYDPHDEKDKAPEAPEQDPWQILGLPPDTPVGELKSHFRRLAIQFHPDGLRGLDAEQRQASARAFIAIKEAYQKILGARKNK